MFKQTNNLKLVIFLFSQIISQTLSPENICQINGTLIDINSREPITGEVLTKYDSGKLQSSHYIENGFLSGTSMWFFENGTKMWEYSYKEGNLSGQFFGWYENSKIRCSTNYKDGTQEDYWRWWQIDGLEFKFSEWDSINNKIQPELKFIPYDKSITSRNGDEVAFEYPDFILSRSCGIEGSLVVDYFIDKKGFIREIRFPKNIEPISFCEQTILTLISEVYAPIDYNGISYGIWKREIVRYQIE